MIALFNLGANTTAFTVLAMAIGFNFGGNFTLFPSITADYFGNKSLGKNYGFVFSSYGVGGIVGPIVGGIAASSAAGYSMAFYPAAIMCLIGAALAAFVLKPPTDGGTHEAPAEAKETEKPKEEKAEE